MKRRKYTISADIKTLARFTKIAADFDVTDSFIEKMTVSAYDEYYYVTIQATADVHSRLGAFFQNSKGVAR